MKTTFGKSLVADQRGSITMIAEEPDDLWIAYNIISKDDIISTQTERKVIIGSSNGRREGKSCNTRLKLTLDINVVSVEYQKCRSILRVKGIIDSSSNSLVKSGVFHTLEIELNQPFELKGKIWSSELLNVLKGSSNRSDDAELAVVLVDECIGNLYLVNKSGGTIEGVGGHTVIHARKKQNKYFFESILNVFMKYVDFNSIKCVVIAGPGSVKDRFHEYLFSEANKLQLRSISDNKSRVLCIGTSTADKQSLKEISESLTVNRLIRDAKTTEEQKLFRNFTKIVESDDSSLACYGLKDVEVAVELAAVEMLFVNDDLFKSSNVETRRKYESLVESVKESGGMSSIFSSAYASGEELAKMTGVAAVLRFAVPDFDVQCF